MNQDWLSGKTGITTVAVGIVATMLTLAVFMVEDVSILSTGNLFAFRTPRVAFYLLAAAVAALFCGWTAFIFRPGVPRIIMALLAVSMASRWLEHLVAIPPMPLKVIGVLRIVVSLLVIIPILRFRSVQESDSA